MKYCKLIKVDVGEIQSNKYYTMEEQSNNTFKVTYGRVGNEPSYTEYLMSKWQSKYNEKLRKQYIDVTSIVSEVKVNGTKIQEKYPEVSDFITLMRNYTKGLVQTTYLKSESVTKAQIEEAQRILDLLRNSTVEEEQNKLLLNLYRTIPRNMRNVRDNLLPHINYSELVTREQDNIDAIKSQFQVSNDEGESSYLETIGVDLEPVSEYKEIDYIINQLSSFKRVFRVSNPKEEAVFQSILNSKANKETKYLIHGTRNYSVLPILETSLKIRPSSNYTYTGSSFGTGIYFANRVEKSLNYTGHESDKVLLIYLVHYGLPLTHMGWNHGSQYSKEFIDKKGCDCLHVLKGNGLINDEIIVYEEGKYSLKYIIHV